MNSFGKESAAELNDSWESACLRYYHLLQGGLLAPQPTPRLRLGPDEVSYADTVLGCAGFYGHDPFKVIGAFGSAIPRKTEDLIRPKWRGHAQVRSVLTSRRLLCDADGKWCTFWHEHLMELDGDASQWSFVLRYDGHHPLMLHGSSAPFFAIAMAWLVYGPEGLQLPAFGPIAAIVQPWLEDTSDE